MEQKGNIGIIQVQERAAHTESVSARRRKTIGDTLLQAKLNGSPAVATDEGATENMQAGRCLSNLLALTKVLLKTFFPTEYETKQL